MIASHEIKIGKVRHKLRLTTRAIMRVETETDQAFFDLIGAPKTAEEVKAMENGGVPKRYKIATIVTILGAAMNDGDGADEDDAVALYEALGYADATVALSEVIAKAFGGDDGPSPDADEDAGGNAEAAG